MHIEKAQLADIETLAELIMAFNAEEGIQNALIDVMYALIDSFKHPTLVASYLAYHEQQVIGYFHLTYTYSFEYLGVQAILDELFLKPAFLALKTNSVSSYQPHNLPSKKPHVERSSLGKKRPFIGAISNSK